MTGLQTLLLQLGFVWQKLFSGSLQLQKLLSWGSSVPLAVLLQRDSADSAPGDLLYSFSEVRFNSGL